MLTLAQASSFFDRTGVFTPDGLVLLFYGQVSLFDDSKRDAGSAYRRVLSVAPGTVLPNPATVNILGQVWLIGQREVDGLEESHRDKYVLQSCTDLCTVSPLSEHISGITTAATFQRWAGVEWVKDGKEVGSSSDTVKIYNVYLPGGTQILDKQVVAAPGGRLYLVLSTHTMPSGFMVASSALLDFPLTSAQISSRTYSAAAGAYTAGATVTAPCLQIRWQNLFTYDSEAEARYQEGDETLVFAQGTSIDTASQITYAGRTWRAVAVDDLGGAVTVHARPTWA